MTLGEYDSTDQATTSLDLDRYLLVVRRRAGVVAAVCVAGALASFGYLLAVPQQTTATTVVSVSTVSSQPFSLQRPAADYIEPATEEALVVSTHVLRAVEATLGDGQGVRGLRDAVKATVGAGTSVVRIQFTARTARSARVGADAVARAYLEYRGVLADDKRDRIVEQSTQQRGDLQDRLRAVEERIATSPADSTRQIRALAERQVLSAELDALAVQVVSLSAVDTSGGEVISTADDGSVVTHPQGARILVTGVGAGLVLGLVAAFVVDRLDRRVRDARDVRDVRATRVIADLAGPGRSMPAGAEVEREFAGIREHLLSRLGLKGECLAVIEVGGGTESCEVAVNLARSVRQLDEEVTLVLPQCPPDQVTAIRSMLEQDADNGDVDSSRRRGEGALRIVASEDGDSDRTLSWTRLLKSVRHRPSGLLIIAVPSGAPRSLRVAAARRARLALLVVARGRTSRADLRATVEDVGAAGGEVAGAVLVPAQSHGASVGSRAAEQ